MAPFPTLRLVIKHLNLPRKDRGPLHGPSGHRGREQDKKYWIAGMCVGQIFSHQQSFLSQSLFPCANRSMEIYPSIWLMRIPLSLSSAKYGRFLFYNKGSLQYIPRT